MNAIIRPSVSKWLTFDEIDFPANARPANATDVVALVSSIRTIGLQFPLTVIERDGRYVLIAGRHRLEALRVIGEERVPARVVDFDNIEARLWTISENLHRSELTALQRSEQIAEFARLTKERMEAQKQAPVAGSDKVGQVAPVSSIVAQPDREGVLAQVAPKPQGGRPESGDRLVARELGLSRDDVRRSVRVDSIIPEAKEAARAAGLDRNQSALLKVASYSDKDQVEAVADIAKARAERKSAVAEKEDRYLSDQDKRLSPQPPAPVKPLRNLECLSAGEFARWIKLTTPNDRLHVVRMLRMTADILEDELQHIASAAE
jgi:ParB family transcriptional regulator, chromosome partitioning protein